MLEAQRTLKSTIQTSGIGVHSGNHVNLKIKPSAENTGIVFVRTDAKSNNIIPALYHKVIDTRLCTVIENESGLRVSTIEHLMSAFYGMGIDNAIVEIDNEEMPIMDGSSATFIALIEKAGVITQRETKRYIKILKPIEIIDGDKRITIEPADHLEIDCSIDFAHPSIGQQSLNFSSIESNYSYDISRARTFGFAHEIEQLRMMGLARGGSLENAIGLDETSVLNPEGLRFQDEFVRHKLLDLLGDLYVAGFNIIGKITAHKPSHTLNNLILRKLFSETESFEICDTQSCISRASAAVYS